MSRVISFSEVSAALDCQARWDFKYGGQLAGSSLREKAISPLLSGGRAWGAAVAAMHIHADEATSSQDAIDAMDKSLEADAETQREHGVHDQDVHDELRTRLLAMLFHYRNEVEPEKWDPVPEREVLVPIPSRTGIRSSSRFKLLAYLDATETDADGDLWIHEVKLRNTLTPVQMIVNGRQPRWYAWALSRTIGKRVVGVRVHERLNEIPKPARMVKTGRKDGSLRPSHAIDQMTTPAAYEAACAEYDEEPHADTLEALRDRVWHQDVPVIFREGELEEAGRELVSAAKLIGLLDTRELTPLRNVKRSNCNWCPFREICPAPDPALVNALFTRRPPKAEMQASENGGDPSAAHVQYEPTTEGAAAA